MVKKFRVRLLQGAEESASGQPTVVDRDFELGDAATKQDAAEEVKRRGLKGEIMFVRELKPFRATRKLDKMS